MSDKTESAVERMDYWQLVLIAVVVFALSVWLNLYGGPLGGATP
jgi:hypothetical protein